MAVMKKKDIDWKYYLTELVRSNTKITDFERLEFAGFLLRRDMKDSFNRHAIFEKMMTYDNCYFADVIASYVIVETPESRDDLTDAAKKLLLEYYNDQIDKLIEIEVKHQEAERALSKNNEEDGA